MIGDIVPKDVAIVLRDKGFNDGSIFARMGTRVKINQTDRWYDDDGFNLEYISHWQPIVLPKIEKK